MRLMMPNPVKLNGAFYLRVHVPADVADKAQGTTISVPVGERFATIKVGKAAKASLRTKDESVARLRFPAALSAVEKHWDNLRKGPKSLSHKETLALAGEMRAAFIETFDEEPGEAALWERVRRDNRMAQDGVWHELMVPNGDPTKALEMRFGGLVSALLAKHGLLIDDKSRSKLLRFVAEAMNEAAEVTKRKAGGDYSDSGQTDKYPKFGNVQTTTDVRSEDGTTLSQVLDKRIADKASGKDAAAVRKNTEDKLRRVIVEFSTFRGSETMATITTEEVDQWKRAMLDDAKLSNNTIAQRIQNLRTLVEYGRKQSFGKLFPAGNPVALVEKPDAVPVPSSERTFRLDEARDVLRATRTRSISNETRWLPWLCAYTGARINEAAQLRADDIFEVDDRLFFRFTTMGGRSLKNRHSERRVPIHKDIIEEGFLHFVQTKRENATETNPLLFSPKSKSMVRDWVRRTLQITRHELQPNHGWRHLFEDWALKAGMNEAAKTYITGRTQGKSAEGYGKSEAMLPALAAEMDKLASFLDCD